MFIDRLGTYNDIVRRTAAAMNLTLFDFDRECWQGLRDNPDNDAFFLRDWVHPNSVLASTAGDKMLANIFSAYYYYRGNNAVTIRKLSALRRPFATNDTTARAPKVCLLRAAGTYETKNERHRALGIAPPTPWENETVVPDADGHRTFFVATMGDGRRYRWPNASLQFMLQGGYTAGDIFYVPPHELEALPLHPGPLPRRRRHDQWDINAALANTKGANGEGIAACQLINGHLFFLQRRYVNTTRQKNKLTDSKRRIRELDTLAHLQGRLHVDLHVGLDADALNKLKHLRDLPSIFSEGALMRDYVSQALYVVLNGSRHLVPEGQKQRRTHHYIHAKWPPEVDAEDISLIPLGAPLPP
jgi:hypothetical protein